MSALYSFFRVIEHQDGNRYSQAATVYADSGDQAEELLKSDLEALRGSDNDENDDEREEPAYSESPGWTMEEIQLDTPKIVSLAITGWPDSSD